jgi:hypothetical protein
MLGLMMNILGKEDGKNSGSDMQLQLHKHSRHHGRDTHKMQSQLPTKRGLLKTNSENCGSPAAWLLLLLCEILVPATLPGQSSGSLPPEVTNKFYSASGKWVRASNTNCLLWSSFPREGEAVTWTGGVLDWKAHGRGIVQWFTNGIPTTSYCGAVKCGLADGHGIAKGPQEEYEGDWSRGSLNCTNATIKYADRNWYRGEIKDGFKSGQGEELMKGGRYIGEFKYDRFNGKGELLLPNGDKITGEWRDSRLDGIGIYHRKEGSSFKVRQTKTGIERVTENRDL